MCHQTIIIHIKSKCCPCFYSCFSSALFFFCVFCRCINNGTSKYVKPKKQKPNCSPYFIFCFSQNFSFPIEFFMFFYLFTSPILISVLIVIYNNSPFNEMTSVAQRLRRFLFVSFHIFCCCCYFALILPFCKIVSVLFTIWLNMILELISMPRNINKNGIQINKWMNSETHWLRHCVDQLTNVRVRI